jgi:1,4-dihydroxy-6-naphthoate synthase
MFHGVAEGLLRLEGHEIETHLEDVQTLNRLAMEETYDVTKISFYAYLRVRENYELLNSGAALGSGCGPLVVARRRMAPAELAQCRIAVPGELTTAHMLLRLWAPQAADRVFVAYDQVMPMVVCGQVDCGVIIHEGRFVYRQANLECLADLGQWWEQATGLPIPLGCIVARKSLGQAMIAKFDALVRQSIQRSQAEPERTLPYVRRYAQELDEAVIRKHIATYVNEFSLDLGPRGRAAVAKLQEMAQRAGGLT